ncbi:nuclear transport factor 2 family protein [Pseudomonas fluorescens]|uniref:nuclear transport factor 2 family protein n=1 Tax=Pseudomonas fluorescens TaxID=294 RepID=UPI0009375D3A|nr:nuclear transport factor 2 family protein [Pseudomonas fluorescens]
MKSLRGWLVGLLAATAVFAAGVNAQPKATIKEQDGFYYLSPGYTAADVADFYWRSLNGWSEHPAEMAKYYQKDGVYTLTYAPVDDFPNAGFKRANKGRQEMTDYFTNFSKQLGNLKYSDPKTWTLLETTEKGTYVFEYTSDGVIRASGKPYHQTFIAILRMAKDGQIQSVREYWDPYVALRDFDLIKKTQ